MATIGAFESNPQYVPGFLAGADLSSYQYCAVKLTTGAVRLATTAGENCLGILANAPDAVGDAAEVVYGGIFMVKAGAAVSQLERLVAEVTTGRLIAQTTSDEAVVAVALSDGVDGDLIPAIIVTGTAGLGALADGKIGIGDAAGASAAKTLSGDLTMTREGVVTVADVTVGSDAAGDILYKSSATVLARLAIGAGGKKLTVNAAGTLPVWDKNKIVKASFTGMTANDDP